MVTTVGVCTQSYKQVNKKHSGWVPNVKSLCNNPKTFQQGPLGHYIFVHFVFCIFVWINQRQHMENGGCV